MNLSIKVALVLFKNVIPLIITSYVVPWLLALLQSDPSIKIDLNETTR